MRTTGFDTEHKLLSRGREETSPLQTGKKSTLMPISFVEVEDHRSIDPSRNYFVLDGKIGELQFPDG